MKSFLIISILLSSANLSFAVVQGSVHDFSSQGWSNEEICRPCHTPHNADTNVINAPLWNHENTIATFTVYSSPTMDVVASQPQGVSLLCLSCHDGTVALDSFGGNTGSTHISGMANLTTDLSDDHPISIQWQHQTNDTNASGWCSNCHGANPDLIFYNEYIECATCHDVHNNSGNSRLLRLPLTNSELCLCCHNK